jgi:hypothetical protein
MFATIVINIFKETSDHMACLSIFKDIWNQFNRGLGELQFLIWRSSALQVVPCSQSIKNLFSRILLLLGWLPNDTMLLGTLLGNNDVRFERCFQCCILWYTLTMLVPRRPSYNNTGLFIQALSFIYGIARLQLHIVVLQLDLRVGVLTDAKNNDTKGTWGFRQVRASLRIKTLRPMCVGVLWLFGSRPPLPLLL